MRCLERMNNALPASQLRAEIAAHLPALRARALRLCRNGADANDLLQDVMERALRFEASWQPGSNLRAWLHQILFSVFVTRTRSRRRERKALEWLTTDPCAWTRPDAPPVMRALTARVVGAIEGLPAPFADAVKLVDLGELTYREAAEALDVPVGTIMSRLSRGRRLLAAALDEPRLAAA